MENFFSEEFLIEITTKRFEYTYEAMWKCIKDFLELRGIECYSPRSCFGALIKEGIVKEEYEPTLAEMIKLRNALVHTYDEEKAKEIYKLIKKEEVYDTFKAVYEAIKSYT